MPEEDQGSEQKEGSESPAAGEDEQPPGEEEEDEVDIALALLPRRLNSRNAFAIACEDSELGDDQATQDGDDGDAKRSVKSGTTGGSEAGIDESKFRLNFDEFDTLL
jgi:hypothetical protein